METTQLYIPTSPISRGFPSPTSVHRMSDPKERFYRHFQIQVTSIQDQIEDIATLSPANGERQDCVEAILAGISRLSNEVTDARDFVPSYDQRTYSQAIKGLTEKLNEATGRFAPKSRFQFKPRAGADVGAAAHSKSENANPAARKQDSRQLTHQTLAGRDGAGPSNSSSNNEKASSSAALDDDDDDETDAVGKLPQFGKNYNEELSRPSASPNSGGVSSSIRKPSFSSARNISLHGHSGLHIVLPSTASRATASGALKDLDRCVVDMTVPTAASGGGAPFAGLAIKNVKRSLLICGTVAGATHVTGLRNCVVVVAARQVRVHECENVDFYLWCASHPIIEDCKDVRFAPLPEVYRQEAEHSTSKNQWDQVDDFKWLKTEPSPNWSVLPEDKRLPAGVWSKDVLGNLTLGVDDVLRKAGL